MEALSKQLVLSTQSGRLKPDVRLGVAVSEFAQSLDEERKREFQKMQTAGTQLCGRDAIRVTEELNRYSERRHQFRHSYGTKCAKFLDRLQTLANIGDVAVGGSQNIIATSVWCAVRLSLQTATNFRSYFERLSSLFMKLGTSWELHNEFSQMFPRSEALQTFLYEYLIVLMRLCRKAVIFSNKSLGGQLWSSLGASFDSEFRPLQEEMDKWGLMIQYKTQQLATTYVVDAEMFRRRDYKQRTLHLLSPNQSQHITTWRRQRRKGDCKWICQTAAYKSWLAEDTSSTLCISGKLGSGKTVAMANLVAQLNLHQTCAFFFCTFKEQESLKATTVLGSIAFHLLDSIPGDHSTWDTFSRQKDTRAPLFANTEIVRVLKDLLPVNKKHAIIVDGLEDCPEDETVEIVSGLRHLMSSRKILLCYSARSGSIFRRLMGRELGVKFSISLDDKVHDEEMKVYITEEVTRRKQISEPGIFTDELVELIKKQLLAGAQGMYLWVALQLESIFPSQPRAIISYEQMLNLINNLPKDLPEAFERALEQVIDHRYGNSIMKMVTAAPSPLTLDEVKVALTVVPGEPVWYAAKIPTNSSQLVALCGGNLLELDEEDEKVRFIHYSVVGHLLQPTDNPRTMLYHFSMQEAEIYSGAVCVTFLNMSIFETSVTKTRKIDGEKLAEKVIGAATHQRPLLTHFVHHFKRKDLNSSPSIEFDIGRLMAEIQADRMLKFDPACFRDYAVSNWLLHSRSLKFEDPVWESIWLLWIRLLCGFVETLKLPFQSPVEEPWPALCWALDHSHKPLVHAIFSEPATAPRNGEKLSQGILKLEILPSGYESSCLGLLLVHCCDLTIDITLSEVDKLPTPTLTGPCLSMIQALHRLIDLGADMEVTHTRNGNNILRMLLEAFGRVTGISTAGNRLCTLLERVLSFPHMRPLLQEAWVPYALRKMLEKGNISVLKMLLSYQPELRLPPDEVSVVGVAAFQFQDDCDLVRTLLHILPCGDSLAPGYKPIIQVALERGNKDILVLLAEYGGLDNPESVARLSPPLLQTAIQRMGVGWVELLLQLGADPNIDYSVVAERPSSHLEFKHLQVTAERGQTLKFLTLLRYGADASTLTVRSNSGITFNRVIAAKLKEKESPGPKYSNPSRRLIQHILKTSRPTALLEACKMLDQDFSAGKVLSNEGEAHVFKDQILDDFGLDRSQDLSTRERREELKHILLELVNTTPPDRLNVQCSEGNTAIHYLTGGMVNFNDEALQVASHILEVNNTQPRLPWQAVKNNYGQSPLRRAINRGYVASASFLAANLSPAVVSNDELTGNDKSILGFAISKGADFEPVILSILHAGANTNATLDGATSLEIAVNMPSFEYAARITHCLLAHGADATIECSSGGSLVERVMPGRREWLRDTLRSHQHEPCTDATKCGHVGVAL